MYGLHTGKCLLVHGCSLLVKIINTGLYSEWQLCFRRCAATGTLVPGTSTSVPGWYCEYEDFVLVPGSLVGTGAR